MAQLTTRVFKTVILQPGESFTLPPDGEITFVSNSSALVSECEVPETEDYVCYKMDWGISDTSGSDAILEDEASAEDGGHPTIRYISISGTQYSIEYDLDNGQLTALITTIEAAIDPVIFNIYSGYKDISSRNVRYGLKFRTFPSLVESMEMKITGLGYVNGLYIKPVADTDCDCFTDDAGEDIYCTTPNT